MHPLVGEVVNKDRTGTKRDDFSQAIMIPPVTPNPAVIAVQLHAAKLTRHRVCRVRFRRDVCMVEPDRFLGKISLGGLRHIEESD